MFFARIVMAAGLATTLSAGLLTSVECVLDDRANPEGSASQASSDSCSVRHPLNGAAASASVSASYGVDNNVFTLEITGWAYGTAGGEWPPTSMAFGMADLFAETGNLWLYTEEPAVVSLSVFAQTGGTSSPHFWSNIELAYYFGDKWGACGKGCGPIGSGDITLEAGESLRTAASLTITGHGDWMYGPGGGDATLRLVAQAWAEDGSPVPLLLSTGPVAFSAMAGEEEEPLTASPEPATIAVMAAGLGLLVWRRRRIRQVTDGLRKPD